MLRGGPATKPSLVRREARPLRGPPASTSRKGKGDNDKLSGGGGDDKSLKGGDGKNALTGGNGTDLECLGTQNPDPGVADVDTITDCE